VHAVIDESITAGRVRMVPDVAEAMADLRSFMFERVYLRAEGQTMRRRAIGVVQNLVRYYEAHPTEIPTSARQADSPTLQAVDYVAGMTDRFANRAHAARCG